MANTKKPHELLKVRLGVALPRYLIKWLNEQESSNAVLIETALLSRYKIQIPVLELKKSKEK